MRASSTATTWVQPCCWRASSATAARVSTGSTAMPRPPSAPKARPWATAQAVRSPVNEPGPRPKTMASSAAKSRPASASRRRRAGISVAEAWAPPGPLCCQSAAPRATAMDRVSVLVSKASRFMVRKGRGRAGPVDVRCAPSPDYRRWPSPLWLAS